VTQKVKVAGSIDLHVFTLKLEAPTSSELLVADYRLTVCHILPNRNLVFRVTTTKTRISNNIGLKFE